MLLANMGRIYTVPNSLLTEVNVSNEEVFFKWSPEYSVNIKTIDNQHQELVNILNRLFVAVSKREGDKAIAGYWMR